MFGTMFSSTYRNLVETHKVMWMIPNDIIDCNNSNDDNDGNVSNDGNDSNDTDYN